MEISIDKEITLTIGSLEEDASTKYFANALNQMISLGYQADLDSMKHDSPPEWVEDKRDLLQESAFRAINKNQDSLSDLDLFSKIIGVNGRDYPYVHFGEKERELLSDAYEEMEHILNTEYKDWNLIKSIGRTLRIEKGKNRFPLNLVGSAQRHTAYFWKILQHRIQLRS